MRKKPFFVTLRDSRVARLISAFLILNILIEVLSPSVAMALTSGPTQPEFTSFEPVATTDMVNEHTGDFTYNIPVLNIPGPDGGGYSMSLSYHSGVSAEEEASWVGYGWTLNPGAINRSTRGFPDEFDDVTVRKFNKTRRNWTQSAKFDFNLEVSSADKEPGEGGEAKATQKVASNFNIQQLDAKNPSAGDDEDQMESVSVSLAHSISYNNYSGFSIANGFGVSYAGASLNMNRSGGQNTFGFSINANAIMNNLISKKNAEAKKNEEKNWTQTKRAVKLQTLYNKLQRVGNLTRKLYTSLSPFNFQSPQEPGTSYSIAKYDAAKWNFSGSVKLNATVGVALGFQVGVTGSMYVRTMRAYDDLTVCGYMYSKRLNEDHFYEKVYDYHIEKESTFNKNDKNLGVPFNNADLFSVTGNNSLGGFRLLYDTIGPYYPRGLESITKMRQLSIEFGLGGVFSVGTDFGIGRQTTTVEGRWKSNDNIHNYWNQVAQPKMRFTNDAGGEVCYNNSDPFYNYNTILHSTINLDKKLQMPIEYSLHADQAKKQNSSGIKYTQDGSKLITGIEITDRNGGKSNYSQPVYTQNELSLTIGLDQNGKQNDRYLAYHPLYYDDPTENVTAVGQRIEQKYANSYLLKNTTTFNYVDADADGKPSDEDFGGWTKFDYKQAYGAASGQWYRYRTPYTGLHYNEGRMLSVTDQTGSMSCGEKEVYYLKCIETKTHYAFFVTNQFTAATFTANFPYSEYKALYEADGLTPIATVTANLLGSGQERYDGLDAAAISGGMDPAAITPTATGTHKLERLERIVLFAKTDLSRPLTTTNFEYEYTLCKGIPNSTKVNSANDKERGKLTLTRVWTESNGTHKSQIAPYQFHYEYFKSYKYEVLSKYDWAADLSTKYPNNDNRQNPGYDPLNVDPWGSYRKDGLERHQKHQPWLNQRPDNSFEPAAWQLKRIQLPSGGEIHVHYEQSDYDYVQDEKATAMVSLLDNDMNNQFKGGETKYCINHADLGISTANIAEYADKLRDYFNSDNKQMYFKMLYNYCEDDEPALNRDVEKYEYVSGYTEVNKITEDGNNIWIHLGHKKKNGKSKKDKTLPRYVCYQELLTNGGRNLGKNARDYKGDEFEGNAYSDDPKDLARNRVLPNTINMFKDWVGGKVKNIKKDETCKKLNVELSYFKLPTYHAKKGGGVRVKRLVSYDQGIETGAEMAYGSEFIYKTVDGRSSGVACNEPGEIREENALVRYMSRTQQGFIDKLTNGRDSKQFEGPMGESLLPVAQVVYSRIIVKNIHSGKSTTGFIVNTYHTPKSYPFKAIWNEFSRKDKDTYRKFNLSLPLGLVQIDIHKVWAAQGYLFTMNDMSGKLASKAVYPGAYDPLAFSSKYSPAPSSLITYNYSKPGEKVLALEFDSSTDKFRSKYLSPGTEEDYTVFEAAVEDKIMDLSIESDINITFGPLVVYPTFFPTFTYSKNNLNQHVTSKVVRHKTHLLSITENNNGVVQTTENLAFDKYTGEPVLTRTFDGYETSGENIRTEGDAGNTHGGAYYSFNIPAAWMYPSMGPVSKNAANTNQLSEKAGNVVTYGGNAMYVKLATAYEWSPATHPLTDVVSASSVVYSDNWFTSAMANEHQALGNTNVLNKANSFFYPKATYAYRDQVKDANAANGKIYQGGVITGTPFNFFNWKAVSLGTPGAIKPEWYSESTVTRYSPYGYPVEEQDALSIKSSAKFGYNNSLPVTVAQNASYDETRFVDFEHGFVTNNVPDPYVTRSYAHTGAKSYDLSANPNYVFASGYPLNTAKGLSVKFWLRSSLDDTPGSFNYGLKNNNPKLKVIIGSPSLKVPLTAIAQTGEWTLYSADVKNFSGLQTNPSNAYSIYLDYNFVQNEKVLVDDFRLQPLDASMNCSVYYPNTKLAAQFDDQHFAVFYEYNDKGQLSRKSIETERGRKLLQEQQHNTPLKNKN